MRNRRGRVMSILLSVAIVGTATLGAGGVASAEPGGIVISEIHYHAASGLDGDDFIELANTSAAPIDVSGWSFSTGITGVIPPGSVVPAGGYFVVSKDAAQFQLVYGFAPNAVYGGNLSNSGEAVTIVDASATPIDSASYLDAAPWPVAPDGDGPSLELRGLLYDNSLPESWGASLVAGGTPGAANTIAGTPATPQAAHVTATPARPAPSQAVVVSAQLPAGATATLAYKVMFAADVTVPFLDDAGSPGGAGDGVFAATIPGQGAGQLVRYRIAATSAAGVAFSYPAAGDSITYEGVVVTNPAVTTSLPHIEWFMSDAVYNDLLANHRFDDVTGPAVITYNGTVYDAASMRVRGNTSRTEAKVSWKIDMPKGHPLDLGTLAPYALDEFALQRQPDAFADVGWSTVGGAGARSLAIIPVRSSRNGAFFGLGRIMETEDGTWRKAQEVDGWSIYKADIGGSLARTASPAALEASQWLDKRTRDDEDYSDVWNLSQVIDAPASAAQKQWMYENLNIPELVNYMAINSTIRHQDSGWYNWFVARDTEGTGRWELWQWDLDWIFSSPASDGKGTFLTPDTSNRLTTALLAYPEIKEMFFRRLRTLADQFLVPPRYENLWDSIVAPTIPDWNLNRNLWGGYSPASARSAFVAGLAERRAVIANNTGAGKPVPASQSAAPSVVINELQYNPSTGQDGEFIELMNPSTTESVDLSGWTIDSIGLTIQPGTVLLPRAHVVFVKSDVVFRQSYGPANRYVGGEYSGDLADEGETVTLRQGARVVDDVTYSPAAPWPTAANGGGPSLELTSPTADNSLPGSWTANALIRGTPGALNSVVTGGDQVLPTTAITAPSEGASLYGPTVVTATANDNVGVTSVALRVDGTVVATDTSAPYSFNWNATSVGQHTLQTIASDAAGNTGLSTVVNATVPIDSTPPSAPGSLTASNIGQQQVTLSWTAATDQRGVTGYQIVRNGSPLPGSVSGLTFTDTGLTAATSYTYTVRALDAAGNLSDASNSQTVTTLATSAGLFSDLWPGTNGSPWSGSWTTSASNGMVDTQTNSGRLTFNDTANAYARSQLTGVAARADAEVLFSYRWSATTASAYFSINLRGAGGWLNGYRPRSGYGLQFASNSTTATLTRAVNGTTTNLATVSGAQPLTTAKQWVRMRVSGQTIQFKRWLDGQSEPAGWTSTVTDAAVTAPGQLFVALARSSSNSGAKSVFIDDLTLLP